MDKTMILGQLYTLRAGLSVLACENDKIVILEKEINEQKHSLQLKKQSDQKMVEDRKEGAKYYQVELLKLKEEIAFREKRLRLVKLPAGGKRQANKELKKLEQELRETKERLDRELKSIDLYQKNSDNALKQSEESIKISMKKNNQLIQIISLSGDEFAFALENANRGFLDRRDWENLDLIIFYIESGRSDTIKEALLLVDRERQTQRLENAICEASQSMQRAFSYAIRSLEETINNGFQQLQTTIRNGFLAQTQAMGQAISKMENSINKNISNAKVEISGYMEKLYTSSSLNNALLQKININSAELAKSCDNLCSIAQESNRQLMSIRTGVSI